MQRFKKTTIWMMVHNVVAQKFLMLLPELKQNNQTLGDLIATLKQPAETNEFRFKITAEDVTCYGQSSLARL